MTDKNYVTATELADISVIAHSLNDTSARIKMRSSSVSFDNVQLFDSNGESLGYLVDCGDSNFAFKETP